MNYFDTKQWMDIKLPMYQRKGKVAFKADLSNIQKLAKHLNNPEQNFKSIHVAGTNGKGSTSHMIASILQEAGYKVGLYTSPHLKDRRERIKINGDLISKQFIIGFIKRNKSFFEKNDLSFFEMTVGLAFDFFSKRKVDIAVVEVGLGGRLDSTNIITPEISVITNIGLDHTNFLGNTLDKIAIEKAGIIKPKVPVVIGETQQETELIFKEIAYKNNAPIYFADQSIDIKFDSDLKGDYQQKNIKTAIKTIDKLKEKGFTITNNHMRLGLQNTIKNTGLLGRWQILQQQPKIICDTAHNKEGLQIVIKQLLRESYSKLHIILGFVKDKELESIVDLFPQKAIYYFCKAGIDRAMEASKIKSEFAKKGKIGKVYKTVREAYSIALHNATNKDVIYIGGSTFVVSEVI